MNNRNPVRFNVSKQAFILAGAFFAAIFAGSLAIFNFVSYFAAGYALTFATMAAAAAAVIAGVFICIRYAKAHKIKNPGHTSKKDTSYYIKRMIYIIVMLILASLAASLVGTFANFLLVSTVQKKTDSAFLRGFVIKAPFFVFYLSFLYKMFIKFGFVDCGSKIYNLKFRLLSVMLAFMIMTPLAIHGSMYMTDTMESGIINIHTALSPNIGRYTVFYEVATFNEDFSLFLTVATVVLTFAAQAGVVWFAYNRGRKIFMKERIRIIDEYETEENV